ncbi:hypothetical protein GCM10010191_03590 [Actinomadura vinacea]|uniref:DUF4829 domain-containing protein n=1 Tax=Actinomadura vinacea TaxID=115336 RepID=A0ABP5VCQ2_9ACTN
MTGGLAAGLRAACCVVTVAILVAGCSGGERSQSGGRPSSAPGDATVIPTVSGGTPSPSRSPRIPGGLPDPGRVDQKDATAVSRAALTVMYSVDSTVDAGLLNAKLRAAVYLAPAYAAEVRAEPVQYVPKEWRQHRAYLAVRLEPLRREAGAPSDRSTAAYRQWEMTTTATGRDDWRDTPRKSVIFVALARSSERAPWRVSDVRAIDES